MVPGAELLEVGRGVFAGLNWAVLLLGVRMRGCSPTEREVILPMDIMNPGSGQVKKQQQLMAVRKGRLRKGLQDDVDEVTLGDMTFPRTFWWQEGKAAREVCSCRDEDLVYMEIGHRMHF